MPTDLERLEGFLVNLDTAIVHAIEHRNDLMLSYLRAPLGDLMPIYRDRMEALQQEIRNASLAQRHALEENGLTGTELSVKLAGFDANFTAFAGSRTDDSKVGDFFGRLTFRWLRPLKGVLKWANIILGSMTAIFGGKDAVEEIKKVIEKGIEDGEDGEFSDGNIIFPRR